MRKRSGKCLQSSKRSERERKSVKWQESERERENEFTKLEEREDKRMKQGECVEKE